MFNIQCNMCNVQCTMYNVQYTMYNVQCTMYMVHCTPQRMVIALTSDGLYTAEHRDLYPWCAGNRILYTEYIRGYTEYRLRIQNSFIQIIKKELNILPRHPN